MITHPSVIGYPDGSKKMSSFSRVPAGRVTRPLSGECHQVGQVCAPGVLDSVGEQHNPLRLQPIPPIPTRAYGDIGVNPLNNPVNVFLACWLWGKYLGEKALAGGVDVCVSSWKRIAPNTLPSLAKAGANYMNSQLIKMEALTNGYAEGIALDEAGYVSEGSGENIFLVRDGRLHTPPLGASVLPGITRDSVLRLAQDLDIPVVETIVPREMLYIADEVFFTGTAAEITPIRSVDRIP